MDPSDTTAAHQLFPSTWPCVTVRTWILQAPMRPGQVAVAYPCNTPWGTSNGFC